MDELGVFTIRRLQQEDRPLNMAASVQESRRTSSPNVIAERQVESLAGRLCADSQWKTRMKTGLLKVKQLAFDVETAAVTAKRSARCDHPVAGDDDGDGIPVVRHADGTVGVRVANGLSDVAVAAGLAVRDFEQRMPARELELGSAEIEREGELASLTREVIVEFAEIGREDWFGLMQPSRIGI